MPKQFTLGRPSQKRLPVQCSSKPLQFFGTGQEVTQDTLIDAVVAANNLDSTLNWGLQEIRFQLYDIKSYVTDCETQVESEVTLCERTQYTCGKKKYTLNIGSQVGLGSDPFDPDGDGDTDNDIEGFGIVLPEGSGLYIWACICETDLPTEGGEGK